MIKMTLVFDAENRSLNVLKQVRTALVLLAISCFICVPVVLFTAMNWFWGTLETCYGVFNYLSSEHLVDSEKLKLFNGGKYAEDLFGLAQVAAKEPLTLGLHVGLSAALCAVLMAIALCLVSWRISRAIKCVDGSLTTTWRDADGVRRVKRARMALLCLALFSAIFAATSFIKMHSFAGAYYDHATHPIQYLEDHDLLNQEEFARFKGGAYKEDHVALEVSVCPVPANFARVCSAQKTVAGSVVAIGMGFLIWPLSRAIKMGCDPVPKGGPESL